MFYIERQRRKTATADGVEGVLENFAELVGVVWVHPFNPLVLVPLQYCLLLFPTSDRQESNDIFRRRSIPLYRRTIILLARQASVHACGLVVVAT